MKRIAFCGLGEMGVRMAERLLDAGHPLTVYNRSHHRADGLVAKGATLAMTPREAAASADVLIVMVTDNDASEQVWLHPETGALAGLAAGALAIESSTVTPDWISTLFSKVKAAGVDFLEAPVAGSRPQAEAGQLIYFVGGEKEVLDGSRGLLDVMSKAIHHCGAPTSAAVTKLIVNAFLGVQTAALGELLGFAQASGLDIGHVIGVLGQTPVMSPALQGLGTLMTKGVYTPLFPVDLVAKDMRYARVAGEAVSVAMPAVSTAELTFVAAQEAGHGGDNIQGVAKLYLTSAT